MNISNINIDSNGHITSTIFSNAMTFFCAQRKKMSVIALTGNTGGKISTKLNSNDIELRVPSNSTARIQETHILVIHCLCDAIDWQICQNYGGSK